MDKMDVKGKTIRLRVNWGGFFFNISRLFFFLNIQGHYKVRSPRLFRKTRLGGFLSVCVEDDVTKLPRWT